MSSRWVHRPESLQLRSLARAGAEIAGQWPLDALPRLRASCSEGAAGEVAWRARGELRPVRTGAPQVWMHLAASADVDLVCQRCLEPVPWSLSVDRSYQFVEGEEAAAALDLEAEHEVLALVEPLDLVALVEDEMLLELPLLAAHPQCPAPLPETDRVTPAPAATPALADGAGAASSTISETHRPFAVLAGWKRGHSG